MYCKQVVRRLLRQCGRKVTAQLPEGEISLTAYLNPLRERSDRLGFGESGMVQQGRWLHNWMVMKGDVLFLNENDF